ncbi:thiolase C-terminal domain-containing protein [Micrococcus sp.]|uniref:thiolase family protein n=1 Tax=Micrococcus sp. TaxID=1271 RepID=UPI002A91FA29|nr:acetyl-CoA C-acyltransferase [Micrococcus sp.]MDY6054974.1 acetyl-CoA C-acyltransferase [Micrococcus sp.]
MTALPPLWITAAARTAVTGRSRAQGHLDVGALAAGPVAAVAADAPTSVAAVVLGNCTGPGGNPGRIAALAAGLGEQTPGWTVDAQCGAGLAGVLQAAQHAAFTGRACIGGGVESPSTAPVRSRDGVPYTQAPMVPAGWPDPGMTAAADALAALTGIDRPRQEAFAARSHTLALDAAALRRAERVPACPGADPAPAPDDDGPRRLDARALARFTPVHPDADPATAVTGGTAARIADGAAAVLVVPGRPDQPGLPGLPGDAGPSGAPPAPPSAPLTCAPAPPSAHTPALRPVRIVGAEITGADPALPGLAPVAAVQRALAAAGWTLAEVAVVEVVEAYAVQALATLDRLGLTAAGGAADTDRWGVDPRVNAAGGALALGHPWGASGAAAVVRAVHRLQDQAPGERAVVACAVAGGLGMTMLLEVT